ncbi:MAG TPA: type 1 glutamine amidotransferase [Patescibacteria group bacterium]|nr:type 1 glutamine amidotransferase [Patescibacteria group bacterium]
MPKEVLIIQHIDIEGPGSIEEFFQNTAWTLRVINAWEERQFPSRPEAVDAIISLGGPMNAYEEDAHPFLRQEDAFLKRAVTAEIPILGICLGGQLLAKACGARITKLPSPEIGWYTADLTVEGAKDPLFEGLGPQLKVFQWHQDAFGIPQGGLCLAATGTCPHQAFRFGRNAYGIQFHIEVTPEMIDAWIRAYLESARLDAKSMLIEAYRQKAAYSRQAQCIYLNFARLIKAQERIGAA